MGIPLPPRLHVNKVQELTKFNPASTFDILRWLLVNAGRAGWNRIIDITAHPGEAVRDVWDRIVDIATHPGEVAGDVWNRIIDITTHPGEAARDLWEWMKANKVTCLLIGGGILVIAVPPLIGFSAVGPVAGMNHSLRLTVRLRG